jgi:hypothetical protein
MSTETTTQAPPKTTTQPDLGDAPPCWPPKAHIIRKQDQPAREGTRALCGARLMGIDLDNAAANQVCDKCVEIARKELGV